MYKIEINCKPTGGLDEHRDFVSKGIKSTFGSRHFSDLTFVCGDRLLSSHQSMIGPLSPLLSAFFSRMNCCNCQSSYCGKKEAIQIHLPDIEHQYMEAVLSIIYTGKAQYSTKVEVKAVQACIKLLGINIDLEIGEEGTEQVENIDSGLVYKVSSNQSYSKSVSRRRMTPNNNKESSALNSSPNYREKRKKIPLAVTNVVSKRMRPEPSKYTETEMPTVEMEMVTREPTRAVEMVMREPTRAVEMQMVMLQELRKLEMGASIGCRMLGCGQNITLSQMTQHFKNHIMGEESQQALGNLMIKEEPVEEPQDDDTRVMFSCDQCEHKFKFRRALDVHIKNYHKTLEDSVRDQISESESDNDSTVINFVSEDISMSEKVEANELKCESCDKILKSEWHRLPFRHNCDSMKKSVQEPDKSLICNLCKKTVKSLWYKPPFRHSCTFLSQSRSLAPIEPLNLREVTTPQKIEEESTSSETIASKSTLSNQILYQDKCNICNRVFANQKSLKYHENLAHNTKINTENTDSAKKIAMDNKSTSNELNVAYNCLICSNMFMSKDNLKMHYFKKHFTQYFNSHYTDIQCSFCDKQFINAEKTQKHIVLKHENVLNNLLAKERQGSSLPWKKEVGFPENKNDDGNLVDYLPTQPLDIRIKKVDVPLKAVNLNKNAYIDNNSDNTRGDNRNNTVESDEDPDDPDDPSYVPSSKEEEPVKPKSELNIKDIKTLLRDPVPVEAPEKPKVDPETRKDDCKCRNCGRMFDTPYKMNTHQRNCKWTCTRCNTAFNLQSEFSSHIGMCTGLQTMKFN